MKSSVAPSIPTNRLFVEKYADVADDNPWHAYYERPGTMSLLPEVNNKSVLDAGCGPGIVSELLIGRGADVVSLDNNAVMIKKTRERLGKRGNALLFDLNNKLDIFLDSTFDIIYCSLLIQHISDLNRLFGEFSRILKPGGVLIFSTAHPDAEEQEFNPVMERQHDSGFWKNFKSRSPYYKRNWEEVTFVLSSNRFIIDSILTPKPTEECRNRYPKAYASLKQHPHFICIRAINYKQ